MLLAIAKLIIKIYMEKQRKLKSQKNEKGKNWRILTDFETAQ